MVLKLSFRPIVGGFFYLAEFVAAREVAQRLHLLNMLAQSHVRRNEEALDTGIVLLANVSLS